MPDPPEEKKGVLVPVWLAAIIVAAVLSRGLELAFNLVGSDSDTRVEFTKADAARARTAIALAELREDFEQYRALTQTCQADIRELRVLSDAMRECCREYRRGR